MESQNFTLTVPTQEEADVFNKKAKELLDDMSIAIVPVPFINFEKGGTLDARLDIYKKTPKEDGTNTKETSQETK